MKESLYQINEELQNLMENLQVNEETGEVDFSAIEANECAFKDKAEAVALYIKSEKAFSEQMKAEEDALAKRRKSHEVHVENLKNYLAGCLLSRGMETLETPRVKVALRSSTVCEVDMEALGDEWKIESTNVTADKRKIAEALKDGQEIAGAALVEKVGVTIK